MHLCDHRYLGWIFTRTYRVEREDQPDLVPFRPVLRRPSYLLGNASSQQVDSVPHLGRRISFSGQTTRERWSRLLERTTTVSLVQHEIRNGQICWGLNRELGNPCWWSENHVAPSMQMDVERRPNITKQCYANKDGYVMASARGSSDFIDGMVCGESF